MPRSFRYGGDDGRILDDQDPAPIDLKSCLQSMTTTTTRVYLNLQCNNKNRVLKPNKQD